MQILYTLVALNRWNGYKFQLQGGHLPFLYCKSCERNCVEIQLFMIVMMHGVALAENTWRHVVVTFKSGTMNFYIDGDLVKTWDAATPNPVPGNALTLATPIDFVIGQDLPTSQIPYCGWRLPGSMGRIFDRGYG